ncbi:hypothetical protein AB1K32_07715 [Metabacillus dongyingensis]|uniref:hypothetical protein n=1 Tax=Metabacillus dongyingensis TaxID=2874282 RepID=UPI003B8E03B6
MIEVLNHHYELNTSILEKVQNYVLDTNVNLKNHLDEKHKGFENGWEVEDNTVVFFFSPTAKLKDNPLRSPAKYKWLVEGDVITPINGRAIELTPELRK